MNPLGSSRAAARALRTALVVAAPLAATALPQTVTCDVECNTRKIGELTLTLTNPNPAGFPCGGFTCGGVSASGGFKLTDAKARDEECWCRDYYWFQAIRVSDPAFGPADNRAEFTDPNPLKVVDWGGGQVTSDYCPFYFEPGGGIPTTQICGNREMVNRNGRTLDFGDGPQAWAGRATPGNPFRFEAYLGLACVSQVLTGDCKDQDGIFKVLAAIEWGFEIVDNGDGTYTVNALGPTCANATPIWVGDALTNFNGKPGVGTWNFTVNCSPCPPFGFFEPFFWNPYLPALATTQAPCSYDAATETLTIGGASVAFLDDAGIDGPTAPQYAGDPVLSAALGGAVLHKVQSAGPAASFASSTNHANLYFDDPSDTPDSMTLDTGVPAVGNPNGWANHLIARAEVFEYDPSQIVSLSAPLQAIGIDSSPSLFLQDLEAAAGSGEALALFFEPDVDLAAATQDWTVSASAQGTWYLAFDDPPVKSYCTAKPSDSLGCTAAMGSSPGQPVSGANDWSISVAGMDGKKFGIFFGANTTSANVPFLGGTLCMLPPLKRGIPQLSAGTVGACDGTYAEIVNTGLVFLSGFDAGPGGTSFMQAWYRSPCGGCATGFETGLSNALEIDWL